MKNEEIKEKLIIAGVNNLKEFGYPYVTVKNILTDEVYKNFFASMLPDNIGHSKQVDEVIEQLLKELNKN